MHKLLSFALGSILLCLWCNLTYVTLPAGESVAGEEKSGTVELNASLQCRVLRN